MSNIHNCISFTSLAIQCGVLIYSCCDLKHYIDQTSPSKIIVMSSFLTVFFIRSTSIAVCMESWLKRATQMEFLHRLDNIDAILSGKLLIDLNYDKQRQLNFRKFLAFLILYLSFEISVGILCIYIEIKQIEVYWTLYAIPLLICVMRYYQFITYVDLLAHRFQAINKFICNLMFNDGKHNEKLKIIHRNQRNERNQQHYRKRHRQLEICMIINKLKHLQHAYRLLMETTQMLCQLFSWSMLFNIGNDFYNLLMNSYWSVYGISHHSTRSLMLMLTVWAVFNISALISLSNACRFVCDEVRFGFEFEFKFDFFTFFNFGFFHLFCLIYML